MPRRRCAYINRCIEPNSILLRDLREAHVAPDRQQRQPVGASGVAGMASVKIPLLRRLLLIISVLVLFAAGGVFWYSFYTPPPKITLSLCSLAREGAKSRAESS